MPKLELKPGHKAVKAYYQELETLGRLGHSTEGTVSPAFALPVMVGLLPPTRELSTGDVMVGT